MIATGQYVGRYKITGELGQGGMATVYSAIDERLDRPVAIKIMHRNFLEAEDFITRFEREARIIARLEHPNIVPLYDFDRHEGMPYLVMKQIDGQTLKARLVKQGPLSLNEIVQVMGAIADALNYAHAQDVLHRDIKPSNIVIDKQGTPYLTDFGLARLVQSGPTTMSADMMLGTPHYISPEQAAGDSELDARTDVYSFGIVLYELLVGQVPFNADTPYAIVHDQIYRAPPPPSSVDPDIPPEVDAVILKALAKNPAERYSSAGELMRDFERAMRAGDLRELRPDRHQSAAVALSEWRRAGGQSVVRPNNEVREQRTPTGKKRYVQVERSFDTTKWPRMDDFVSGLQRGAERLAQWGQDVAERIEARIDPPPSEEELIRREVKKRLEAWRGFRNNLIAYLVVNLFLWLIWASGEGLFFNGGIDMGHMWASGDIPWPLWVTLGWGIGVVSHGVSYYSRYGGGHRRFEKAVDREVERLRRRRKRYSRRKGKRGDDAPLELEADKPKRVRLTEDGELTESFVEEVYEDEERRYR